MFCKNCGKEIDDNSKFCQYCGENYENKTTSTVSNNEKSGCGKLIAVIFGTFLFVIALMFLLNDFFKSYPNTSYTNVGRSASLEVTESHSCDLGYGARAICGTIKNNSNHNVGYVQVEINLYDKKVI